MPEDSPKPQPPNGPELPNKPADSPSEAARPEDAQPEATQEGQAPETRGNGGKNGHREDAGRGEVALYAFGNVEASIADQFFNVLNNILIVAMHVNPLLIGLILGIKTLWDSVTDPVMAWITDNTRSRWGRRRPYILVGGVSRIALLVFIVAFMPTGGHLTPNPVMEAQKFVSEAVTEANGVHKTALQSAEQVDEAAPEQREAILGLLPETIETARAAVEDIRANRPTLEEDLRQRQEELAVARVELQRLEQAADGRDSDDKALRLARGKVQSAQGKVDKARELLVKSVEAERKAIAAEYVAGHVLAARQVPPGDLSDPYVARAQAAAAYATAGIEPIEDIFHLEPKPAPTKSAKKGMFANIADGVKAFNDPANAEQRSLIVYVLFAVLLFTTLTTVQSVPYFALGIELSPSYNGRTQVVVYRAVMNKIAGLVQPWIPVLCFSLLFATALDGLFWVAIVACAIGIPSTVLMCMYTKERTHFTAHKAKDRPSFIKSMWQIGKNPEFLKIAGLYCFIGLTNGLFQQLGFFLNVYWVMGSALSGAKLGAWVAMVAWGLGFLSLPVINWGCRKFQKHRMLQFAIIWMAIGTAMKWWAMNPEHPEYQFVLPFFFSIGIGSIYTILPTLMADVTDMDELAHGVRREGMFGAVMAFIMKGIGTFTPILAGAVLVMSGFDPALEYEQEASTIFRMRLMYSFIPAGMLLFALLLLWKYPLTSQKVAEIKEQLRLRHEADEEE
ncbi:MAG: MFS transporter [Oceanipulchritudo sp.]